MTFTRMTPDQPKRQDHMDVEGADELAAVSIIMPAKNAEEFIEHAIESVIEQRYQNWELLVVDDASTDDTSKIVAAFTDPRVRFLSQPQGGEAKARNLGMEEATGKFLAFLDADDRFAPAHLEFAVRALDQRPECGAVYSDGYYCDRNGRILKPLSARMRGPFQGWVYPEVMRAPDVFGHPGCVVIRRNVPNRAGIRFDPTITIGPDWDFLTQVSAYTDFAYVSAKTYFYRLHGENITFTVDQPTRQRSLAICRSKAINSTQFSACRAEYRLYAFEDLLVNLLRGDLDQQSDALAWPQFQALPQTGRARLLRRMASSAILDGSDLDVAIQWLNLAVLLNKWNLKTQILRSLLFTSPSFCKLAIKARKMVQIRQSPRSLNGRNSLSRLSD